MTPQEIAEIEAIAASLPISVAEYTQKTVNFDLHEWQKILCGHLYLWATGKGQRLLIHAPPQFGKSIIVAQRLIAYVLGLDPLAKVGLACYNIEHAEGFGEVVLDLMRQPEYAEVFPNTKLSKNPNRNKFRTVQRAALKDGQYSFMALGLLSGFTGKGVSHLIIDDPYASADDARSEAINERVWRWWSQTAKVRLTDDANVLVMFHRYHEDDFAGRLLAEGDWTYLRFPAIADGEDDDPTGRQVGELLSPMRSEAYLAEIQERDPQTYLSQFQGRPRPPEGAFILRQYLKTGHVPPIDRWVRFWDLATSEKQTGDYTVGALVGIGDDHTIYLRDIVRFRLEWPDACEFIAQITEADAREAREQGYEYSVGVEKVAALQALVQDLFRKAIFERVSLWPMDPKGRDKKERASGWVARAKFDKFRMAVGPWNQDFINECVSFTGAKTDIHDDQVDAVSGAYHLLWHLRGGHIDEPEKPAILSPRFFQQERQRKPARRVFG